MTSITIPIGHVYMRHQMQISDLHVGHSVRLISQMPGRTVETMLTATHVDTITGYARISAPGHEPIDVPLDAFDVDRFGVFYRLPVGG